MNATNQNIKVKHLEVLDLYHFNAKNMQQLTNL
jgi:hypothetical protein